MNRLFFIVLLSVVSLLLTHGIHAAPVTIPGSDIINDVSIGLNITGNTAETVGQSVGLRILAFIKLLVSGFALVFMVMIGAKMVIYSETEENIKTQKRQIVYVLIAFLFLNIPGAIYSIMAPSEAGGQVIATSGWTNSDVIWYTAGLPGFVGSIMGFFRVFAYGAAILMLTWGFFRLILSAGDEEKAKTAKSRVIYSLLALVFLLFVEVWVRIFSSGGSLAGTVPGVASTIFRLGLFFAAPVAIFFIIYGAYYYITSAGDEERIKKGKNILINTFIASLILVAAFSFLSDLVNFNF